ncbi:hypothetical protein [Chelatococcus daeguensis]|uniref:hypothetical protein n=1 Tax=Chelatococcus daeguensis TaxID=444444 RepID=UPI0011AE8074|nr:hypothetical protein [Chelatococcus daeguensis]
MPEQERDIKAAIEIWKKTIDVQQHFNDLCLRIRNTAITVVGALLAAMGFTYQQGLEIAFLGYRLAAGMGFVAAALFAWLAFFLMDYYWYHMFLKGAVKHASKIEEEYKSMLPGIDLGGTISSESQNVRMFWVFETNSQRRLKIFYGLGFLMLAVIFVVLLFAQKQVAETPATAATTQTAPRSLATSNEQPIQAAPTGGSPESLAPSAPEPSRVQKTPEAQ